jgi:hypothetical protein
MRYFEEFALVRFGERRGGTTKTEQKYRISVMNLVWPNPIGSDPSSMRLHDSERGGAGVFVDWQKWIVALYR